MQLARPTSRVSTRAANVQQARTVRVQAQRKGDHQQAFASAVTSVGLAALLLAGPANASAFVDAQLEREVLIAQQKQQIEYLLQQQENVRKAQLLQQRSLLDAQVGVVEAKIQSKMIEKQASVISAEQKGDAERAAAVALQQAELEEQAAAVRKAAAQIESKLDRVEMLQRAKAVQEKQTLEKVVQAERDDINEALDKWLEGIANVK